MRRKKKDESSCGEKVKYIMSIYKEKYTGKSRPLTRPSRLGRFTTNRNG